MKSIVRRHTLLFGRNASAVWWSLTVRHGNTKRPWPQLTQSLTPHCFPWYFMSVRLSMRIEGDVHPECSLVYCAALFRRNDVALVSIHNCAAPRRSNYAGGARALTPIHVPANPRLLTVYVPVLRAPLLAFSLFYKDMYAMIVLCLSHWPACVIFC